MAELDQRIAMHKAEIDNMSQDIVSATTSDIGTSALANIALPSNLQQILDSIKTIGAATNETVETQVHIVIGCYKLFYVTIIYPLFITA